MDILETSLWTYWKPVCGPIGNRFMDLLETGLWTYAETGLWTYAETSSWGHSILGLA